MINRSGGGVNKILSTHQATPYRGDEHAARAVSRTDRQAANVLVSSDRYLARTVPDSPILSLVAPHL
ncbi:MAG: hypothetical protein O2931_13580 [Planctomycetota bacterium]|nr:hypothetical protein [Planctomycetota bacterium]MDA1179815.1 hypothetical protein [Planctomycetota bacterium]